MKAPWNNHTNDGNVLKWLVSTLCLEILNLSDDALAVDDLAEDNMLLVQVWRRNSRDKELRAIGTFILC
jgi:hypothetical protein